MCIPLLLAGCVSQSELTQVMDEKNVLEEKLASKEKDLEIVQKKVGEQSSELQKIVFSKLTLCLKNGNRAMPT